MHNQFQYFHPEKNRYIDYEPRGESAAILACGNVPNMENIDVWRVNDYADLGNALKLSAVDGQITFVDDDGRNIYFVRVLLSDRKDLISKTILY